MPQPARWFLLDGEEQVGPMTLGEMREKVRTGQVGPDDYVWADGMPSWLPAGEVPALIPPPQIREDLGAWAR